MKVLTAPLWELAEFEEGKALLDRGKGHVAFSGLYDSQKLHMVYGLSDGFTQKIIVTFSDKRAREIGAEYGFYDRRTMVYPGKDLIFYQADVSGGDLVREPDACAARAARKASGYDRNDDVRVDDAADAAFRDCVKNTTFR